MGEAPSPVHSFPPDAALNSSSPSLPQLGELMQPVQVPERDSRVGTAGSASSSSSSSSSMAKYKSMSPASLPISRSPCLTIPPGMSPSTLLESPVLLCNSTLAEPSPTTGTFTFQTSSSNGIGSEVRSDAFYAWNTMKKNSNGDGSNGSFGYKSQVTSASAVNTQTSVTLGNDISNPLGQTEEKSETWTQGQNGSTPPSQDQQLVFLDQKEPTSLTVVERPSEDGYNWRKYGQKLVKGCEFPRSYYKCTHPQCQVKKKLERSHEGVVTAIIYEGQHNHPKPQPSRRLAIGAVHAGQDGEDKIEAFRSCATPEDKSARAVVQNCGRLDANGASEPSSLSVSDDDEVDRAAARGDKLDEEADEDDPDAKRRKKETANADNTVTNRTNREPRVVVQTLSEVDILDDGYRWRKYGQKVVKGNPNPRSYYKCTNAGCPVRKHVERAAHDPKSVITTYEGKHNHDVPSASASASNHEPHALSLVQSSTPLNYGYSPTMSQTMQSASYQVDAGGKPAHPGTSNNVSLDLGVGISRTSENNIRIKQETGSEFISRSILPPGFPNSGPVSLSPYRNDLSENGVNHYKVEERGQGFSFGMVPSIDQIANRMPTGGGRMMLGQQVDAAQTQQIG